MKVPFSLLLALLAAVPACEIVSDELANSVTCEGGTVRTANGDCFLPDVNVDDLGLPTTTSVTNFAPAILPVVAVLGAVAAVGAAGAGNGTNGTNGTN